MNIPIKKLFEQNLYKIDISTSYKKIYAILLNQKKPCKFHYLQGF